MSLTLIYNAEKYYNYTKEEMIMLTYIFYITPGNYEMMLTV